MVRAVGFDLDGTLFDDRQYVRMGLDAAARELESRTGVDARDEFHEAYIERGICERTFDHVLDEHGLPAELVDDLVRAYHAHEGDLSPYDETGPVLEALADEYRLGLLTGGTNGREKLDRLGIASHFDAVVVAAGADVTKRDSESFVELLDALDVRPSETAYVGDRPEIDFVHPNDLGVVTVRIALGRFADVPAANENEEPDVTIESLDELPELLAELD
jgi:putative hydrolase of the HAD superfamily